jgi:L,D-peptidoglycan transpeptidase YkuD (ErfK/YbiS/YcfS/YnhG family)
VTIAIARRAVLALPAMLSAGNLAKAAAGAWQNLEYRDGRLIWPGGTTRAAVGRAGVSANKKEGDGATPAGIYPLVSGFYRADRIAALRSGLPLRPLTPNDAWVDDPADRNYNRLASLPYPAHTEPLWLDDAVYDLLAVIGYNMDPVVPGVGSAIFLHIARSDFSPTAGCVAIDRDVLLGLMPLLGHGSTIAIRG